MYRLGHKHTIETRKKIGRRGKKHCNWKGGTMHRKNTHHWLDRWYEKPKKCEHCGEEKLIDWANINGHIYRYKREDYIGLCKSCHKKMDIKKNPKEKERLLKMSRENYPKLKRGKNGRFLPKSNVEGI